MITAVAFNNPTWVHVNAGASICLGEGPTGNTVEWPAPSAGYFLNNTGESTWCSSAGGIVEWNQTSSGFREGGSYSGQPVSKVTAGFGSATVDTGLKLNGDTSDELVWFHAATSGAAPPGFAVSSVSASPNTQTLTCSGTGYDDYGCNGGAFKNANPSSSAIADAYRSELSQDSLAASTVSCVISADCETTNVAESFTMPDCYGLSTSDCLFDMQMLGFTGSLQTSIAGTADYTQPAGLVISTDPAAYAAGVSTAAATVADAYTNPDSCEWIVQNPHASSGTPDAVDVKATATCTYATTIHATLTLWKCDESPEPDLTSIEAGEWGCVYVAEATDTTRNTSPGVAQTFMAPDDGELISGDNKYFIAYGTLDVGTPASEWSSVEQIP